MAKKPAVIFDLDNTLADVSHLLGYITGDITNYDVFHELASEAKPIDWVVWELKKWLPEHAVVIVTARQRKYQESTMKWLADHEIPYDLLWMRPTGDDSSDYIAKAGALDDIQRSYSVVHAYDDNPSTVQLWLEHMIPTTVVPGWPVKEFG